MITNRESRMLDRKENKVSVSGKYAHKNKYIVPGMIEDLISLLCMMRLRHVVEMAIILGVDNVFIFDDQYNEYSIRDIESIEGDNTYASSTKQYYFYAGPELKIENRGSNQTQSYALIKGTVLSWIVDCVMLKISQNGPKVLKDLGLPL